MEAKETIYVTGNTCCAGTAGIGAGLMIETHPKSLRTSAETILKYLRPRFYMNRRGWCGFNPSEKGFKDRIRRSLTGFTLVEMLVVLAVIAMLLAVSIPFTSGFGKGMRIKTAARGILGVLRVAKSNAITYRKKYAVVFDIENNEYWIEDSDGRIFEKKYRLSGPVKFRLQQGDEISDPVTFEDDKVIFYSTGAIEGGGGSVTITDRRGNSKTISILGSTGKITID